MTTAVRGLYEVLITEALDAELAEIGQQYAVDRDVLRAAEAADRIALHLGRLVERVLLSVSDKERVAVGTMLARRIVKEIAGAITTADVSGDSPSEEGGVLRSILSRLPDGSAAHIRAPLIPLLDTTLLTNAPGEPRVGSQLLTEIASADRIDIVMAFIRRSGIAPLLSELRDHCQEGRELRVLTTTYTNSTELRALTELLAAGAQIRISYDESTTRLHAKAWLFHRHSGFSTAYIGSSNLTHSAQISGLEWNVRLSGARNRDVIDKTGAVFESYWNATDFVPFDADEFAARTRKTATTATDVISPVGLRPEPFQERMLEQIAAARLSGYHRNLVVSATGTGKTVMAAIDYARLVDALPRARLLFVAHREEILAQSRATFRHALHDPSFGEYWVGGERPERFDHVFASIQSLNATGIEEIDPRHYDVVIVDEFHHAAAPSYQGLLGHLLPIELLGLTATPERSDGLPILEWFDHRIAAELRLWDAIDRQYLAPFHYYGVHDGLDLREVPWRRGRGYDTQGLTNVLTANDVWAKQVIRQVIHHCDDPSRMRALGFCVSVQHARFMARVFSHHGIKAVAVWGDSPDAERQAALADLSARRIQVLFSVDLFNEGLDLPAVDTLLLLRPTDSPILFLQQLGRGLRRHHGKTACTVLDFVGQHRSEFRFDRRFRALLGGSRKDVERQIERGFPFLPAGCHMELDRVAREIVLDNIKRSVPSRWTAKIEELRSLTQGGTDVGLKQYLNETSLDLDDVYAGNKTWSNLRSDAGLSVAAAGQHEVALGRACGRLLHVDDRVRMDSYRRLLASASPPDCASLSVQEQRLTRMLLASLADSVLEKHDSLQVAADLLWSHPRIRAEISELMSVLSERIDRIQWPLPNHPNVPLQIHARYTRTEVLAAFGVGEHAKVAPWQTGVYWAKGAQADLFAVTLDKTTGEFSPTTRYRDYAISPTLIHWESQSVTRADSDTGKRYQHHAARGSSVLLFARLRSDDRAFWFLGPATYVKHEGERPMAITWRLHHALPGDLFTTFAAAVA